MCTRSAKSDCWKKKSNQNERGLIDVQRVKKELQGILFVLYFSYICSLVLVANDKFNLHYGYVQKRKLQNII